MRDNTPSVNLTWVLAMMLSNEVSTQQADSLTDSWNSTCWFMISWHWSWELEQICDSWPDLNLLHELAEVDLGELTWVLERKWHSEACLPSRADTPNLWTCRENSTCLTVHWSVLQLLSLRKWATLISITVNPRLPKWPRILETCFQSSGN